jgi:hypothetical protein
MGHVPATRSVMFWRILHDFIKWAPVALGGVFVAFVMATLAAAQIWEGAKIWARDAFLWGLAMAAWPWIWVATGALVLLWLAAFVWSTHKLAEAEAGPVILPAPRPRLHHLSSPEIAAIERQSGLHDRRGPLSADSDTADLLAEARAIAGQLDGRLRLAREVQTDGDSRRLRGWFGKLDTQRVPFSELRTGWALPTTTLDHCAQARRMLAELDGIIDFHMSKDNPGKAIRAYIDRADKARSAVARLIGSLE